MAATFNFKQIMTGDTFTERTVVMKKDGVPIDLTGAVVSWQLKVSHGADVAFSFPTTLSNPSIGEIKIAEFTVALEPGVYLHDLQITHADGKVKTYLKGNIHIHPDISS